MMNWLKKKSKQSDEEPKNLNELFELADQSEDFVRYEMVSQHGSLWISYMKTLIDIETLHRDILPHLQKMKTRSLEDFKMGIPIEDLEITKDIKKIKTHFLKGYLVLQINQKSQECLLVKALSSSTRSIGAPEIEFSVLGPKEAFIESLDTNIHLIRKRLPDINLTVKEFKIGTKSQTRINVLYLDHIANDENVQTVLQRIKDIEYDQISDSSFITQMIADNQNSPFPQLIDTERPDRVASVLGEGKIAIAVDGSPQVLIGPTNLLEFFSAFEDYFLSWHIATAFRLIRIFSVLFSVLATPIYVAIMTFHYELIPKDLLSTLITSRSTVPFPPILEALILELTIELLREAGARLPTKVGQTIGIVGGIVIGTASVEAGLTSNVLLIIVALSALASFTTPVYKMGNTIRLIRFPFLFFAQLWGLIGIVIAFCFVMVHLIKLKSLGRPYLQPLYPPRITDFKDTIIRLPFTSQSLRPLNLQTEDTRRFSKKKAKQKKDIDE
ncbi:spore germination protein [Pseudalkalibacillus berkeleyi]|uniref:Spore germination protein n=1 Tax=Pseudalkalibacillus berkeleyi TaxID=1069813 RepID=A0ABS9H5Y7_9BACL|nr:spore germination protein [Pseudalkalibacillus berkeleyi]MCF6139380.1 spore germination protein [Pseudalkalibacillus berkeleyi]